MSISAAGLPTAMPGSSRVCAAVQAVVPSGASVLNRVPLRSLVDRPRAAGSAPLAIAMLAHIGGRPVPLEIRLAEDGAVERVAAGWIMHATPGPKITHGRVFWSIFVLTIRPLDSTNTASPPISSALMELV